MKLSFSSIFICSCFHFFVQGSISNPYLFLNSIGVNITINIPEFTVSKIDPSCNGQADGYISFDMVTGGSGNYLYSIDGGLTYSDESDFFDLEPNEYLARVVDDSGCESVPQIVGLFNPAILEVNVGDDILTIKGDEIILSVESNLANDEILDIIWKNSNVDSVICIGLGCQSFNIVAKLGTVSYCAEVTSKSGCVNTDCTNVKGETAVRIYIPNVISPNAKTGMNQYFFVSGAEDILMIREMKVFDKWGALVFENQNFRPNQADLGWNGRQSFDGSNRTNDMLESGVYFYYILIDYIGFTNPILRKGTINLLK